MDVRPGDHLLGRYTTVERLGSGGMGEVWRATDEVLGRDVAIKFLARHLVADDLARDRFRREAQLAGSLSHPHVVAVHDAGTQGDAMVLVMEVVEGGTLADRITEHGHLPVDEAVRIGREILSGLSSAHDAGLVHRDVKPGNVMFTSDDRVKLTDFGIARLSASDTTRTAEVYGSAPYLAPERAEGHQADPASDVYAVGCILYEMLTGTSPFTGETPAVTVARHLSYDPPAPSTHDGHISPALDAVVKRALAKDPTNRYADATDMLADLERAEARGPVAAATVALSRKLTFAERRQVSGGAETLLVGTPRRDRQLWPWLLGAALVMLLGLTTWGAAGGDWEQETEQQPTLPVQTAPAVIEPADDERTPSQPSPADSSPAPVEPSPPATVEDTAMAFIELLDEGATAGSVDEEGVEKLTKALDELLEKHADDDVQATRKEVGDLAEEIRKRVEDGQLTNALARDLRDLVDRFGALVGRG